MHFSLIKSTHLPLFPDKIYRILYFPLIHFFHSAFTTDKFTILHLYLMKYFLVFYAIFRSESFRGFVLKLKTILILINYIKIVRKELEKKPTLFENGDGGEKSKNIL